MLLSVFRVHVQQARLVSGRSRLDGSCDVIFRDAAERGLLLINHELVLGLIVVQIWPGCGRTAGVGAPGARSVQAHRRRAGPPPPGSPAPADPAAPPLVPDNEARLRAFRNEVHRMWLRLLRRVCAGGAGQPASLPRPGANFSPSCARCGRIWLRLPESNGTFR
jgi:hypothetical protein